jgi:hypothetical protein
MASAGIVLALGLILATFPLLRRPACTDRSAMHRNHARGGREQ